MQDSKLPLVEKKGCAEPSPHPHKTGLPTTERRIGGAKCASVPQGGYFASLRCKSSTCASNSATRFFSSMPSSASERFTVM